MYLQRNPSKLEVYSETRHSRVYVGTLTYNSNTSIYTFEYDRKYLVSKMAIPLGPELSLRKRVHQSKKTELFPSLQDRIPSKDNPAYGEYCKSQGIDPKEKDPIILLTTIGKRGPSTFVFEPVYLDGNLSEKIVNFRKTLDLSVREVATAFGLNYPTLNRIENKKSTDKNTLALLEIYLSSPDVALWILQKNERKLHTTVAQKLITFFTAKLSQEQASLFDVKHPKN